MLTSEYRAAMEAGLLDHATYRQQLVSCGKRRCRTCAGTHRNHGPYWYAEWQEKGKTRTRYIGKRLPAAIAVYVAATGTPETAAAAARDVRAAADAAQSASYASGDPPRRTTRGRGA